MSAPDSRAEVDFIHGKLVIISMALGTSPLIYAFVIYMLSKSMPVAEAPMARQPLGYALVAAGILAVCAALIARSMLLDPDRLAARVAASNPRPGQPAAYVPIMTAQIIPMAAAEAAGILGIVLFILTRDLLGGLLLAGVSFSTMLLLAPRRAELSELLDRLSALNATRRG